MLGGAILLHDAAHVLAAYPEGLEGIKKTTLWQDLLAQQYGGEAPPKGSDQENFRGAGVLLKAGEQSYRPTLCGTAALPVCRWGDFEAVSNDLAGQIWFAGEYANLVNTPVNHGRNWGTWIGAINAS